MDTENPNTLVFPSRLKETEEEYFQNVELHYYNESLRESLEEDYFNEMLK